METRVTQSAEPWHSRALLGALALGAIAGVIMMQKAQLDRPMLSQATPQQVEQQEGVRLNLLKRLPNLGFNNMVADWAFLNYLQYYGDETARQKTGYSLLSPYFDVITQRDPRFIDCYLFLTGSLSYQLGQPELAAQYLKRGTAALSPKLQPRAFTLWRFLGLDQLLLTGDVPGAIHSHQMAAAWAAATGDPELQPVAKVFALTAQFLTTDPDSRSVRLNAWATIFAQATARNDIKTQALAKQAILALGGVEQIDQAGHTFFTLPPASTTKVTVKGTPLPKK